MRSRQSIEELVEAIQTCRREELVLPALCLSFVLLDTLAGLTRGQDAPEQSRADFVRWVDDYLMPDENLGCSALDLYGARCGLLHAYSATSRLAKRGEAKKIGWAWGEVSESKMQSKLDGSRDAGQAVAVHFDAFLAELLAAKERFHVALAQDPTLAQLVEARTGQILVELPVEFFGDAV